MPHPRFVAEVSSSPCLHGQNDRSKEYHTLIVHVVNQVTGQFDRSIMLSCPISQYTTNAEMLPIFNDMARLLNAGHH